MIHKVLGNDRYEVRDINKDQLTQLPYDGVIEAYWIKNGGNIPDCIDDPEVNSLDIDQSI